MKQIIFYVIGLLFFLFTSCEQREIKPPHNAIIQLEAFKQTDKFHQDKDFHYPGITNASLRAQLAEKINMAADDFIMLVTREEKTPIAYQNAIKIGLNRFANLYPHLNTEDRVMVCSYYQELMDIIGLESSDGHLNYFIYGFNSNNH